MATIKHRPSPLDEPPSASSSSEDDRNSTSQKPEEEEDSSDDDSSSEEEAEKVHASTKPPSPTPSSNPKSASSESESDSEPKPEQEPTPPPNTNAKPLASKPTKVQTSPLPAKSGTKRAMENTNTENDSKRSKKTADNGSHDEKEVAKASKTSSHRLFSEEDELAILKGLADFISKTGKDPMNDTPAFYSFVKKSLQADANKGQLRRKLRSLKNKYESNGDFTKEHDKKAFELFQKIGFKNEAKESNKKTLKNCSTKEVLVSEKKEETVKDVIKSLSFAEMVRFGDELGLSLLNMDAMKKGMELMGESKMAVFEERWEKVQIAEMELLLLRAELVRDQTSMILEAYKNSN